MKFKLLVGILALSLMANLYLLLQMRLKDELIFASRRSFWMVRGKDKIEIGMLGQEAIARINCPPDVVEADGETTRYIWSTAYTPMPLNDLISPPISDAGHFWLYVTLDLDGRVIEIIEEDA